MFVTHVVNRVNRPVLRVALLKLFVHSMPEILIAIASQFFFFFFFNIHVQHSQVWHVVINVSLVCLTVKVVPHVRRSAYAICAVRFRYFINIDTTAACDNDKGAR